MAATVTIDGDAREIIQEFKKLQRENTKLQEEFRKSAQASTGLDAIAKKAIQSTRTETEKYEKTVGDLRRALKAGKIDLDTYGRAVDQAASGLGGVAVEQEKAFGDEASGNLSRYVSGLASVLGPLEIIRKALVAAREESERLAEDVKLEARDIGELAQISDTRAEFQQRAAQSRSLLGSGAVQTLGEAAGIVFKLDSAGLVDDFATFEKLLVSGFDKNIGELITSLSRFDRSFINEGLSTRQILNKSLSASGVTQENLSEVLAGAAKVGQAAPRVGIDADSVLALTSSLSQAQPATEAATQLRALFLKLATQGIKFQNAQELVSILQKQLDETESFEGILGDNQSAILGATNVLSDVPSLLDNLAKIQTDNKFDRQLQFIQTDPAAAAAIRNRAAEGANRLELEDLAILETQRETVALELDTLRNRLGQNQLNRAGERGFAAAAAFLPSGAQALLFEANIRELEVLARGRDDTIALQQLAALREQVDLFRGLRDSSIRKPNVPTPEAPTQ